MTMPRTLSILLLLTVATGSGCARTPAIDAQDEDWESVMPAQTASSSGAIFNAASSLALFEDLKARQVGDILTVRLAEKTNAQKSSSTTTAKSTSAETENANVLGYDITSDGVPVFSGRLGSEQSFSGEGGSSQSNQLEGSVTVTVVKRMPNGNLVIRGEKWLTLNQGREFIRISGVVRPVDIEPDNSVPSEKVGSARIVYSGKGALANANRMGWLARFFNSPWSPL